MSDLTKPLFQCTLGEIAEALAKYMRTPCEEPAHDDCIVKGIRGIMEIFSCSEYTARKIKQSGVIDKAITQYSTKTFVVNARLAKELYHNL